MRVQKKAFLIIKRINTALGMISGVAIICLSAITFFEAISRKVFNSPTLWSHDIAAYMFVLVSFFAFTFTMQEDGHISFSHFVERVKYKTLWPKIFATFSGILGAPYCFLLFYMSLKLTILAIKFEWMTHGHTQIPSFYLYILMCFGSMMLFITFLMKIIMVLFNLKEHGNSSQND